MADPTVRTEPSNKTIDLGLDPEITPPSAKEALNDSFNAFFGSDLTDSEPEPVKTEEKVDEPSKDEPKKVVKAPKKTPPEIDTQVTPPQNIEEPKKEGEKVAAAEEPPPSDDEPDPEIDGLKPPANPKQRPDWEKLQKSAKARGKLIKAYEREFGEVAKEYGLELPKTEEEAKQFLPQLREKIQEDRKRPAPKEVLDELEQHRAVVRKLGVATNQQFQNEFVAPADQAFLELVDSSAQVFSETGKFTKEQVEAWVKDMKDNNVPSKTNNEVGAKWWQQHVLNNIPDTETFSKSLVTNKIQKYLETSKKLGDKRTELSNDQQKFQEYHAQNQQTYENWFRGEQTNEIVDAVKGIDDIHEWGMAKPEEGVTDPVKLKELKEWNQKHLPEYQKAETDFKRWLGRMAGVGDPDEPKVSQPAWHVRAAVAILRAARVQSKLETVQRENNELKAKLKKHEENLDRQARLRSVPARPQTSGTVKAKPQQSDSMGTPSKPKSVRDAFADWDPSSN